MKQIEDFEINKVIIKTLFNIQVLVGALFMVGGVVFPIYIEYVYKNEEGSVYDRFGNIIGSYNYTVLGVILGALMVIVGFFCLLAAKKALKNIDN